MGEIPRSKEEPKKIGKEQYKSDEVVILNKGRGRVEMKRIDQEEKRNPDKIKTEKDKLDEVYGQDNKGDWEVVNGKFRKVA